MVTGLMSGRPFSYEGRHFHLDGVEFAPQPVQRPRVPIWVAGTWPYRKPFRRAARYDGVVPIARDTDEVEIMVDVAAMREIVAYTDEHRTDDGAVRPRVHGIPAGGHDRGASDRGRARVVRRQLVAGRPGAGRATRCRPRVDPPRPPGLATRYAVRSTFRQLVSPGRANVSYASIACSIGNRCVVNRVGSS